MCILKLNSYLTLPVIAPDETPRRRSASITNQQRTVTTTMAVCLSRVRHSINRSAPLITRQPQVAGAVLLKRFYNNNNIINMDDSSMQEHGMFILHHSASDSTCGITDVGATILNFHPSPARGLDEVLFVSRSAILDGSRAVRGGVPLVFPCFGPPSAENGYYGEDSSDMPQHGFARTNRWTRDTRSVTDTAESASVVYSLRVTGGDQDLQSLGSTGLWAESSDVSCELTYKITLMPTSLTTQLTMVNTSTKATMKFPMQSLLHTYYQVHHQAALDPDQCFVKGLLDYQVIDKVDPELSCASNTENPITIQKETDRVYHPPADHRPDVRVEIGVGHPQHKILLTARGTVQNKPVPVSCVVWNPHSLKARGMSDFGDDQYREMICVEPGILQGKHVLEANQAAVLEQTITVVDR